MFQAFIDDESVPGRRLQDEELRLMLKELRTGLRTMPTWRSIGSRDRFGSTASRDSSARETDRTDRESLVRELFNAYDKDSSGFISESEMRKFADRNGFKGTDAEWHKEYEDLCNTVLSPRTVGVGLLGLKAPVMCRGIDFPTFSSVVNDNSVYERPCLTDHEIRDILNEVQRGLERSKTFE